MNEAIALFSPGEGAASCGSLGSGPTSGAVHAGSGTLISAPHFGHTVGEPAVSSGVRSRTLHWLQRNSMGMGTSAVSRVEYQMAGNNEQTRMESEKCYGSPAIGVRRQHTPSPPGRGLGVRAKVVKRSENSLSQTEIELNSPTFRHGPSLQPSHLLP